ncbi:hypothetical protein AYI70_g4017 [Smittium culicis]|uniref:Hexosyltransferase n=1 Tax=Smittium culicis TaxID=133412 RepID=A0A1R1Y0W0_9FUNG|nr:hypothetical protein AYI70_g4017 [Smittium culicis]
MDFDAILDKNYVHGVLKFIADNHHKYIYYGNLITRYDTVFNGGNFYALSSSLFRHYCNCHVESPDSFEEDLWFGSVIKECLDAKSQYKNLYYMQNDITKILHKEYFASGVQLKLGRKVNT